MKLSKEARALRLDIEGCEPFVFAPLGGRRGLELSHDFLDHAFNIPDATPLGVLLQRAVDGVDANGAWVEGGPMLQRLESELTLDEGYSAMHAVLYWHTILGLDGARAFLAEGGDRAANLKATWQLVERMAPSRLPTLLASGWERPTPTASTPATGTPDGGENSDAQPDGE